MSLVDSVAPALGYPITLSDDADNLSDDSTRFAAWELLFGQTLTFYDKLFADFLETSDISDDLAAWLDAVSKALLSSETITATGSINNLADALLKRLPQALSVSDAHLDLVDSLASVLAYRLAVPGDQIVLSDAVLKNLITQITQTAADSMTLTGAVTKTLTQRGVLSLKSEFDNYIRKFLNDPGGLPPKREDED